MDSTISTTPSASERAQLHRLGHRPNLSTWDAIFSIPAVREGLAAYVATVRLTRLIGAAAAKELCLLGRRFSAEEGRAL